MDENTEENLTIVGELKKYAEEKPDKSAFVFWDRHHNRTVLTRWNVWEKSLKCAAMFKRLGIKQGDIVCNTLVNSQERVITTFGVLLLGATSMHGQKLLADGEDIMNSWMVSKCKFIIVDPNEKNGPNIILERTRRTNETNGTSVYDGLPFLLMVIPIAMGDRPDIWLNVLNNETETFMEENISQDDVSFIFTTSGTTGFAKLVQHTHSSILRVRDAMDRSMEGTVFNIRSLGWIGGFPSELPVFGFNRVLIDESKGQLDNLYSSIVDILQYESVDMGLLLSVEIQGLLEQLDAREQPALKSLLKVISTGGGPISTSTMKAINRLTKVVMARYASTEMILMCGTAVTDPDTYQNGCVGLPSKGISVKVLDDDMNQVPSGTSGEIFVLSKSRAKGYLNNPKATREAFLEDGWFRTSDIGHLDEKGQLYVYCRKSNCINHKGFIHYPGWMETRINKHPSIKECVILGIPDPITHEELCLCVIKEPNTDLNREQAKDFCKDLFLTEETDHVTPIPKYCLFFESFPRNNNLKIKRNALRKLVIEQLTESTW